MENHHLRNMWLGWLVICSLSGGLRAGSDDIPERIERAQRLNKLDAREISEADWDFIRSEVYRGRGSNLVEVLADTVHEQVPSRASQALSDLGRIGPAAGSAVPIMLKALDGLEWIEKWSLMLALGDMGPAASNAVPHLIEVARAEDSEVRPAAIEALGGIGKLAAKAEPVLKEIAKSSDEMLAATSVNALARISEDPTPYLSFLISELNVPRKDRTTYSRSIEAMETLEALGPAAKASIPALVKHLDFYSDDHVRAAAKALGAMRAHGAVAEKRLRSIINNQRRDLETRIVAAEALGRILGGLFDGNAKVEEMKTAEAREQQQKWDKLTRKQARYTSELPVVTRVEISSVTLPPRESPVKSGKTFPIRPYGAEAVVHAHTNLVGVDAERIAEAWRNLEFGVEYSGLCHEPVYGLRFFGGKKLLLETSVCWKCSNFYVPDGWMGFREEAPSGQALLKMLDGILPYEREQKEE